MITPVLFKVFTASFLECPSSKYPVLLRGGIVVLFLCDSVQGNMLLCHKLHQELWSNKTLSIIPRLTRRIGIIITFLLLILSTSIKSFQP